MKKRKLVGLLLAALTLFSALTVGVSALTWVGSSQGGTSGATSTSTGGYAIRTSGDNVVGYRFSVVNASGSATGNVIDVFRNTSNGNSAYSSNYKISTKRNKTGWIANQNANVTTTLTTAGCYKESTIGFYAALPSPDGMGKWQEDKRNLDPILEIISKKELTKALLESNPAYAGYKVLVEPIYEVKLEDVYHALTVTELAIYGKYLLGASSDGGSSYTSGSWGFISNYTNMYYPNELFTPNGMGLWTNANGLTSRTTFYTIINSGYGVGIAYANTKKPDTNYTIMFNGNGAESGFTPSMSMKNTESANLEKNGFIRKGYKFDGWATSSGGGVVFTEGQSVNKTILTGKGLTVNNGSTVTLYAHWTPYKMTFRYNANGGSVESNTFKVYSTASTALQLIAYKSNSYVYSYEVDYSSTAAYTVRTPESFGLSRTGYTFRDWAKTANSPQAEDLFSDGESLKLSTFDYKIYNSNCTVTFYALWEPITYQVKFNGNGSTAGTKSNQTFTYDVAQALSANSPTANGFERKYKVTYNYNGSGAANTSATASATFNGWAKSANGSVAYSDKQSVKNLASTQGAVVNLYAK